MGMQQGYIAETANPFWVGSKLAEVHHIYHPYSAITTACGYNSFDTVIIDKALQIFCPEGVVTRKLVPRSIQRITQNYFEPPGLKQVNGSCHWVRKFFCRAGNCYFIALFQIWGDSRVVRKVRKFVRSCGFIHVNYSADNSLQDKQYLKLPGFSTFC